MNVLVVLYFLMLFLASISNVVLNLSLVLLIFIGIFAAFSKNYKVRFTLLNVLFFILMPMQSLVVGMCYSNLNSIYYSGSLIAFGFAMMLFAAKVELDEVFWLFILSGFFASVFIVMVAFQDLITGLAVVRSDQGQFRFSPLGYHPNLIGHNFGALSVVAFTGLKIFNHQYKRLLSLIVVVLSLIFVLAASSRGGLLSALIGIGYISFLWIKESKSKYARLLMPLMILGALGVAMYSSAGYLTELLEINSEYRGTDSGFTGRADAWPLVLDEVQESTVTLMFGHGFRSWNNIIMGIQTEVDNSYINLLYDVGLITTLFVVSLFIVIFLKCSKSKEYKYFISLLVFCMIEGMVSRYLLGIGNPSTVLLQYIVAKVIMPRR